MLWNLIILLTVNILAPKIKPDELLLPIKKDGRIGFVNLQGKVVIPSKFRKVGNFSEGLAPARLEGLYGYIDQRGEYVIPPIYDYAEDFSDGVAIVYDSNGHPSCIDHSGKTLFSTVYKSIEPFENGCAIVHDDSGRAGLINKKGVLLIDTIYWNIERQGEGTLSLWTEIDEDFVAKIIDTSGQTLFSLQPGTRITEFKNGTAKFHFGAGPEPDRGDGLIDKHGRILFKKKFHFETFAPKEFQEGKAIIRSEKLKKWERLDIHTEAIIDTTGKIILDDSTLSDITGFENNKAFAVKFDSVLCQINQNGTIVNYFPNITIGNHIHNLNLSQGRIIINSSQKDETSFNYILDTTGKILFSSNDGSIRKAENPQYYLSDISSGNRNEIYIIDSKTGRYFQPSDKTFRSFSPKENCLIAFKKDTQAYMRYDGFIFGKGEKFVESGFQFDEDKKNSGRYLLLGIDYKKQNPNGLLMGDISELHLTLGTTFTIIAVGIDSFEDNKNSKPLIAQKFILANTSNNPIRSIYSPFCVMQAKDKKGDWKDIEKEDYLICGTGVKTLSIPPGKYLFMAGTLYSGSFKTKLRLKYRDVYSNEFDGSVNPAQFWRE
jgi:hypothetical protein